MTDHEVLEVTTKIAEDVLMRTRVVAAGDPQLHAKLVGSVATALLGGLLHGKDEATVKSTIELLVGSILGMDLT